MANPTAFYAVRVNDPLAKPFLRAILPDHKIECDTLDACDEEVFSNVKLLHHDHAGDTLCPTGNYEALFISSSRLQFIIIAGHFFGAVSQNTFSS